MSRTENLTIMFADVVGYTQRTSAQSRTEIRALLERCKRLLLPQVRRFGGWQIKNLGDAVLVAFRSPTDAVRCGMALHDALASANQPLPENERLHIRVALAQGEVLVQDQDVFGEAVNLAARIEAITPAGAVYFSEGVYLAMNKAEVPSQSAGSHDFKGIPEAVRVYAAAPAPAQGLPYGGMHQQGSTGWAQQLSNGLRARPLSRSAMRLASMCALLLLVLFAYTFDFVQPTPAGASLQLPAAKALPDHPLLMKAQPWLAAGQYEAVRKLYQDSLTQRPQDAEALLLQGHDLFQQGKRPSGVASYEQALNLDPSLRDDPLLARNLARGLSWAAADSLKLLTRHATPAMVDAVAARTAEPGARGRERAAELLRQLGQAARIDRGGMALQELREASGCEARRPAVQKLGELRERRAIADLEALSGGGLSGWWNNRCLRNEAAAALKAIKAAG